MLSLPIWWRKPHQRLHQLPQWQQILNCIGAISVWPKNTSTFIDSWCAYVFPKDSMATQTPSKGCESWNPFLGRSFEWAEKHHVFFVLLFCSILRPNTPMQMGVPLGETKRLNRWIFFGIFESCHVDSAHGSWWLRQRLDFWGSTPCHSWPTPQIKACHGLLSGSSEDGWWVMSQMSGFWKDICYEVLLSWYHDASKKVNMMCESRSCLFLCVKQMCQSPRCSLGHQALQSHHLGLGNSGHPFSTAFKVKTKYKNQTCSMSIWTHIFSGGIHGLWDFFSVAGRLQRGLVGFALCVTTDIWANIWACKVVAFGAQGIICQWQTMRWWNDEMKV